MAKGTDWGSCRRLRDFDRSEIVNVGLFLSFLILGTSRGEAASFEGRWSSNLVCTNSNGSQNQQLIQITHDAMTGAYSAIGQLGAVCAISQTSVVGDTITLSCGGSFWGVTISGQLTGQTIVGAGHDNGPLSSHQCSWTAQLVGAPPARSDRGSTLISQGASQAAQTFLQSVGCSQLPMTSCELLDASNAQNIMLTNQYLLLTNICGTGNINQAQALVDAGAATEQSACKELIRLLKH